MISGRTKHHADKRWLPLAFVAFICWAMLSLSSKYLFNQGLATISFLFYLCLIVAICILAESYILKIPIAKFRKHLGNSLMVGIFASGFNLFMFQAIRLAPNIGYVNAINAASIALIALLAPILFKDELSVRKLIGVLGITAGLVLLLI